MQAEAHIERVAYECAIDVAADGVVYAEVRFAPELHQERASGTKSTESRAPRPIGKRTLVA